MQHRQCHLLDIYLALIAKSYTLVKQEDDWATNSENTFVERNVNDLSKLVTKQFNLPNLSKKHMIFFGFTQHLGNSESRKTLEQTFIFQIGTLVPHGINEGFSFN